MNVPGKHNFRTDLVELVPRYGRNEIRGYFFSQPLFTQTFGEFAAGRCPH